MGHRRRRGLRRRGLSAAGWVVVLVGEAVTPGGPVSAAPAPAAGVQFTVASTGMCLNVKGGSAADTTPVVQFPCGDGTAPNDKWQAVPMGDGTYHIVAVFSGKCLNVDHGLTTDDAAVLQYACSANGTNDRFRFRPVAGKPTFQLVAAHSGKCLHVRGNSSASSTPIVQFTCNAQSGLNEQYMFPPASGPTPRSWPMWLNAPVVVTQGQAPAGASAKPLVYSYVDNRGVLRVGFQANPDLFGAVQWSTPAPGEGFTGEVDTATQADGRVEVVARNTADGDLWTVTQAAKGLAPFGDPQEVGGSGSSGSAVGRLPDGKLVGFVNGGGEPWHLPQDGTNTPYAGWRSIGWRDEPIICADCSMIGSPTVAAARDGLRIFAHMEWGFCAPGDQSLRSSGTSEFAAHPLPMPPG